MPAGVQAEGSWRSRQFHPSLIRSPVTFAVVAGVAAGDEVFPCGFAGAGARDDVVECHLA